MNIYILKKQYDYAELSPQEEMIEFILKGFKGEPMIKKWRKPRMEWYTEEYTTKCDFPLLYGTIPVMSKKAKDALFSIIPHESVEYLPISVENETYYAVNVLNISSSILNTRRSKIEYYSDGTLMFIDKYVFYNEDNILPIFKVSQSLVHSFVIDEFKDIVESENLTGIDFKKCKVTKRWF